MYAFENGIDVSVVSDEVLPNKDYGNSTTIVFDIEDANVAKMVS